MSRSWDGCDCRCEEGSGVGEGCDEKGINIIEGGFHGWIVGEGRVCGEEVELRAPGGTVCKRHDEGTGV